MFGRQGMRKRPENLDHCFFSITPYCSRGKKKQARYSKRFFQVHIGACRFEIRQKVNYRFGKCSGINPKHQKAGKHTCTSPRTSKEDLNLKPEKSSNKTTKVRSYQSESKFLRPFKVTCAYKPPSPSPINIPPCCSHLTWGLFSLIFFPKSQCSRVVGSEA